MLSNSIAVPAQKADGDLGKVSRSPLTPAFLVAAATRADDLCLCFPNSM